MRSVWAHAPGLTFMAMQGESVIAFGGYYRSGRVRGDNDAQFTLPRRAAPGIIQNESET